MLLPRCPYMYSILLWRNTRCTSLYVSVSGNRSVSSVPQTIDLLDTYRGLVLLRKIRHDEEQLRVVMQLRRIQKSLDGYAPPALSARYMNTYDRTSPHVDAESSSPWWEASRPDNSFDEDISTQTALVQRRSHAEEIFQLTTPKGLLLTGPPGAGKSFVVDLWFNSFPTSFKARKHYNELVLELYRAVWEETKIRMASGHTIEELPNARPWSRAIRAHWKKLLSNGSLPKKWARTPGNNFTSHSTSPQHTIAFAVARRLILRHWLLVFDEIQLLDVSSATLLADVLSWFWRMGGVVIGTSNKIPDDLYMNGVQRERLEPFVEALKVRCPVYVMRSEHDWREIKAGDGLGNTWYMQSQETAFKAKLTETLTEEPTPRTLYVFGRSLHVPWSSGGMCKFTFSQLCDESLGSADYLTLSSHFHTFAITDIPVLQLSSKNQARRFISLIDALYESRCKLICLAEAGPSDLFFPDATTPSEEQPSESRELDSMIAEALAETQDIYRPNISSYDAPNMTEAPEPSPSTIPLETLSIFSGKDEQFAFKRALSRLLEMTSESYGREAEWTPLPDNLRKWEQTSNKDESSIHSRNEASFPRHKTPGSGADFASEAAYEGHPRIGQRPEAPRLREYHVWGMREESEDN